MLRSLSTSVLGKMTKVAIGQICSTGNVSQNLLQCTDLISRAAKGGAKALFLPEASDYIAASPSESLTLAEPADTGSFMAGIMKAARDNQIAVNVGIHEPAQNSKRVKNTLVWVDENGVLLKRYQKIHLFDVDLEGGPKLQESQSVEPGSELIPPFDTPVGKIGLLICFDLRFPEASLWLAQSDQPPTIITYPSAFTIPTGQAHWSTLLRARAIETQSYVIAAAQAGKHNEKRQSYGHSMVIDPWGKVLSELSGEWNGEPELDTVDISEDQVENVRKQVPLKRRWDVYGKC